MCTFKKATKNVEVKVDVQKGGPWLQGKFDNKCASSVQFTFSSIVVIWQYFLMTTLFILDGVCIWILGFYKLKAHGALMGSLEFFSLDCG